MRVRDVVWLSAFGMTISAGATAWLTEPARPARAATAPEPQEAPIPAHVELGGTLTLDARVGHAELASGDETYLYFRVRAARRAATQTPLHAAVLIDRSGSMRGARLRNALEAARGFVRRLRTGDRVSVLSYDRSVRTLVPSTQIDERSRAQILAKIEDSGAGGATCISCALVSGIDELARSGARVTHVLLLSDGEATLGEQRLEGFQRIARRARERGIGISSIGVDVDYNEALLSALATLSNGRHHFVRDPAELERAFDRELAELAEPIATNVVLEVDLTPGTEVVEVFDRDVERSENRIVVRLGTFSADEEKTFLVKLRLPSGAPAASFALRRDGAPAERGNVGATLAGRSSELDPAVAVRLGASRTGSVLFDVGKLYKSGEPADFEKLENSLTSEIERVERDRQRVGATSALTTQKKALQDARDRLVKSRGARCACAPGDLMCAMRCAEAAPKVPRKPGCDPGDPLCATEGDLSDDEKAAAKDSVGASNPFKK